VYDLNAKLGDQLPCRVTLPELRIEVTESAKRKIVNPLGKVLPGAIAPDVHPAVGHVVKAAQITRKHTFQFTARTLVHEQVNIDTQLSQATEILQGNHCLAPKPC
jgi:hypothetical protein